MLLRVNLARAGDGAPPILLGITWDHPKAFRTLPTDFVDDITGDLIMETVERRSTICILYECDAAGKPGKEISRAVSNCYFKDRFEREAGRKLTLRRALVFTNLTRSERTQVWDAYHRRKPNNPIGVTTAEDLAAAAEVFPPHLATVDIHAGEV